MLYMKDKKLIIFDFDGVIIDSETLHLRAFNTCLKDFDIQITDVNTLKVIYLLMTMGLFQNILKIMILMLKMVELTSLLMKK